MKMFLPFCDAFVLENPTPEPVNSLNACWKLSVLSALYMSGFKKLSSSIIESLRDAYLLLVLLLLSLFFCSSLLMLDFLASGAGSSIRKRRRANELAISGDREMMLFSQAQRS
jgi:hypothetical protein